MHSVSGGAHRLHPGARLSDPLGRFLEPDFVLGVDAEVVSALGRPAHRLVTDTAEGSGDDSEGR
ncbi:hypothetical protein [Streptomyces sp. NPDC056194]|uniref:hypothetical protein n=1 Tax=unclassified Streptomyces TaxID=2593676 RepID=UPI0035D8EB4D